jgi:hypothetical protein
MTASARQHSRPRGQSATFAETSCRSVTLRSRARNRCGGRRPCSAPRSKRGRPQRPGNQLALARFRMSPAVHPQEPPVVAGSSAIIQQAQECPRVAAQHSPADCFGPQQEKARALVQKLWTTNLPCGRLRKTRKDRCTCRSARRKEIVKTWRPEYVREGRI